MTETAPLPTPGTSPGTSIGSTRTGSGSSPAGSMTVAADDTSIGQLVASASRDVSTLIRSEIALAKSEVKVSVRAGGLAAALFAAAGFVLVLAVIMLSVALAYFVHLTGLGLAWSFLIVFAAYLLVAGVLGFVGYRKVRAVRPPQRAIQQAQETKDALLHRS